MISFDKLWQQLLYDPRNPLLFNSGFFLYFLFAFLLLFYAVRANRSARVSVFTLFSLYFFYKACGAYVGLIVLAAVVDFTLSNRIYRERQALRRKLLLTASIVLNLGLLFYFKYTNFFIALWNDLSFAHANPLNLMLPIGISFYTFENLSYTIDVYRGEFRPVRRFLDYLFFLSFFPKLVMGPIVRAADFIPQIGQPYSLRNEDFSRGFFLIGAGLFKKIVLSDYINVNFVQYVFDDPARHSGLECLLAVYGYALVIYCDFSGYSDIAIGLARWTGFHLPDNFRAPYQSTSITEFWRRWHISLSSWLRDYLYIPLGGNRKGRLRTYANLLATMVLGGFWHGASWNFLIWGALHGLMLAADKKRKELGWGEGRSWRLWGGLWTFHFVCFCWIFFRADSLPLALAFLRQIFTRFGMSGLPALATAYAPVWVLLATGFGLHLLPERWSDGLVARFQRRSLAFHLLSFVLLLLLCLQVKTATQVLPIYLQF